MARSISRISGLSETLNQGSVSYDLFGGGTLNLSSLTHSYISNHDLSMTCVLGIFDMTKIRIWHNCQKNFPVLTLKAWNKNCSRRIFNFLFLSFEENKA